MGGLTTAANWIRESTMKLYSGALNSNPGLLNRWYRSVVFASVAVYNYDPNATNPVFTDPGYPGGWVPAVGVVVQITVGQAPVKPSSPQTGVNYVDSDFTYLGSGAGVVDSTAMASIQVNASFDVRLVTGAKITGIVAPGGDTFQISQGSAGVGSVWWIFPNTRISPSLQLKVAPWPDGLPGPYIWLELSTPTSAAAASSSSSPVKRPAHHQRGA